MHRNDHYRAGQRIRGALTTVIIICAGTASAQMPMHYQHLDMRDGLSQGTVTSILQDEHGFVWLGTENGLNRYDGHALRHYFRDRRDPESLASDFIWSIEQDARGNLWLATVGGGVAVWDRELDEFTHFRHVEGDTASIASDDVRTLLIDRQGFVWIGTLGGGLDRIDPATGEIRHYRHDPNDRTSLSHDNVYALHEDQSGQLWVGTAGGLNRLGSNGFYRYAHEPLNPFSLSDNLVTTILEDHQGVLWVGTAGGGLNKLDRGNGRFSRLSHDPEDPRSLSDNQVRVLLEDQANRIWVGTSNGLNLLDRENGRFTRYRNIPTDPDSLPDNYIMSLYQDRSGLLWVGTRSRGVSRWNPRSWSLGHFNEAGLQNTNVTAFADDGRGRIWVGTFGSGLKEINTRTGAVTDVPGLPEPQVMSLLLDERDNLWIGTMTSGLLELDTITGELRTFSHDPADTSTLAADGIMALHQSRDGDIWIGTFGGGINRLDRETGSITRYEHGRVDAMSLSSSMATSVTETPSGKLWIGTDGGGLNWLDPDSGRFRHFKHDPSDPASLSADTVYSLHIDVSGALWIGTAGGGLDRLFDSELRGEHVEFQGSDAIDLPSNVIYGIQSDHEARLWLSSNNGLTRYDPATGQAKTFHRSHGTQSEEFNFGAHFRGADGRLYFGGTNGFNAFYPADLQESDYVPPVVLTSVEKLHQPLASTGPYHLIDAIELGHKDNVVALEFAALDFTAPGENRYSYLLEGFDTEWTNPSSLRRATYTNLAAGNYVLRVRAANSEGRWNQQALALPISVQPAPWNTVWARMLYAVVALALLMVAWRNHLHKLQSKTRYSQRLEREVHDRTRQLEAQNVELERLSRTKSEFLARMSHEVRTPMNGVLGMAELLLGTKINQQQRRFTETIHESAKSLLEIIDDILDYSKIEAGRLVLDEVDFNLRDLVEETVELLSGRAQEKGLELMCMVPAELDRSVRGDPLRLRQVLVNLIGNAVKFTEVGEVLVTVELNEELDDSLALAFQIEDTGIGIEQSHQRMIFEIFSQEDASTTRRYGGTGLGLAICKQLVELMQGTLDVQSELGSGSTFRFTARLQKVAEPPRAIPRLVGLTALVVDGNATQRRILGAQLDALAIESVCCETGHEAIECLDEHRSFDFALLSFELPDMPGEALGRRIREHMLHQDMRIVLISNMADAIPTTLRRKLRIDAHLIKPIRQRALCQTLTVLFGPSDAQHSAAEASIIRRNPLGACKRLLLVEDNAVNEAVAVGMLEELDCSVEVARDGQQALDALAAQTFDAILMDCQLPVMDGFAATARIRELERQNDRPRTPIIALTANAVAGERQRCLDAGMDDYLSKPFSMEGMHETLRRWLCDAADAAGWDDTALLDSTAINNIRQLDTAGRSDLLERIIRIYLEDSAEQVHSLSLSLERGDLGASRRLAHSLKSSSANLGAHTVAELCQALEHAAQDGRLREARSDFRRLRDIYPRVVAALQLEIGKRSA